MNHSFIVENSNQRLVILFAGWGMDSTPFSALTAPFGYDLMVVWDYRTLRLDVDLQTYKEICIVAWSYGVAIAGIWMEAHPNLPITRRIAVAGTLSPVDEERGIPVEVFEGTLQALSPTTLTKFYRRMAGRAAAFAEFKEVMPSRDIDELTEELKAIRTFSASHPDLSIGEWDSVYIPLSDYIIPTANQKRAWRGHPDVREMEWAHLPDFKLILSLLSCKPQIAERFALSSATYDENAGVQARIAARLAEIWQHVSMGERFDRVVEVGAGTGAFTRRYLNFLSPRELILLDLASISPELPGFHRICDAEIELASMPYESADAIVSASTVQWFNSLSNFLRGCGRVLRPGGVAVLSTFGPATYSELDGLISPQVRYTSLEALKSMLPSSLKIRHLSEEFIEAKFSSPRNMLDHMRLTGVTASSQTSGERLGAALAILRSGVTTLTYQPVYAILERVK